MKKTTFISIITVLLIMILPIKSSAVSTHTVARGDTMWKIAVKYEVGLSEIASANPQIKNPNLIYPGDIINIPSVDSASRAYESEVIRLVNIERTIDGGLAAQPRCTL